MHKTNNLNCNFKGRNLIPVQIAQYIEAIDKTIYAEANRKFQTEQTIETGFHEIFIAHSYSGQAILYHEEILNLADPLILTEQEFLGKGIFITELNHQQSPIASLETLRFNFNLQFSAAETWAVMSAVDEDLFKNPYFNLPHISTDYFINLKHQEINHDNLR